MKDRSDHSVVIMAGGFGRRLGDLTRKTPKPLVEVGGTPIIEHVIRNFIRHGYSDFHITLHYLGQMIQDYCGDGSRFDACVRYVTEMEPRGTAGCLSQLKHAIRKPVIVSNADLLMGADMGALMDHHLESGAAMTFCAVEHAVKVDFGVLNVDGTNLSHIEEKPTYRFPVASGVYVLSAEAIDLIPDAGRFDMPDVATALIKRGEKVEVYVTQEDWIDIGRVDDLERANHLVQQQTQNQNRRRA
ncbi:MAG: NTP transferase domain-containing protein [Neomegalonema sp.]|nr:NTP transferase domain-containing protein [Neomegalonema sp.]